ncbi:hypothetical protein DNTS_026821 [Danionella cerebrum]|nr:hypothetical protein DNTS_026821 [Danionella translucida]
MSTESKMRPLLSVQPSRGLVDEKFQIIIKNLWPKQEVTLHALHRSEDKDFWEAFGHYISDEQGTVSVDRDESLGGTYEGTEQMGLLWSLRPVEEDERVHSDVYAGHLSQGFSQISALETTVVERWYMAPGVERVDIRERGVRGTLFLPPGDGPYPGVMDLWGGGGGLVEYRSALLASHGFASLALEYLAPEELRTKSLPDPPKPSKGSEGAHSNLQCCVCISGSHVVPVDKSIYEAFQEFRKNMDKVLVNEDNHVIQRGMILPIPADPSLKVDVGRIKCPFLLVNGGDDQNWASVESAEDIELMMKKAGNRHLLTVLTYPGAGHLIEPPYTPHFRATNFLLRDMKEKIVMLWGGHTKPHAVAQEDAWEKILAFLNQHLYFSTNSSVKAKL